MSNLEKLLKTFHSRKRKQSKDTTRFGALSKRVTPFSVLRPIFIRARLRTQKKLYPNFLPQLTLGFKSKEREKKKKKWKRVTAFSMLAIQLQLLESRLVHSCLQTCKPWPSSLSSPCKAQGERAGSSSLITLQTSARGHLWNDQTPLKPSAEARTLAYSQIVYLSVGHDLVKCDFETIVSWKWTKSSQEGKKSP